MRSHRTHGYPTGKILEGGLLLLLTLVPDTHVTLDCIGNEFPHTPIKASVLSNVLLAPGL